MRTHKQAGFTLVEILVTVAIIGILIGITLGISGLASKKSDESKTRAQLQLLSNALEEYRIQFGSYPNNLTTLINGLGPAYTNLAIVDPWGRSYQYTRTSAFLYTLKSTGAKSADASDDLDATINPY
jgi:general secretion pathway protein G